MMIPKEAKVCPFCRRKVGNIRGAIIPAILIVFFIVWVTGMVFEAEQKNKNLLASQQSQLTAKGKIIKDNHPAWPNETCNAVGNKEVSIGMNKDQVIAAWGKPYRINTTESIRGSREQWVMSRGIASDYLYFEGPILVSLQQSKSGR